MSNGEKGEKGLNAIWNQLLRFLGEPLQEDNGNYSAMRLMGLLALGASIYFGTLLFSKSNQQQAIFKESVDIIKQSNPLSAEKKALLEKIIDSQNSTLATQEQNDFSEEFWIVLSFLSFGFGGKFVQKIVEPKEGRDFTEKDKDMQINTTVKETSSDALTSTKEIKEESSSKEEEDAKKSMVQSLE